MEATPGSALSATAVMQPAAVAHPAISESAQVGADRVGLRSADIVAMTGVSAAEA